MKTALSLGPKCNYNVAAHIERGINLPKVVNEKHHTSEREGEGGGGSGGGEGGGGRSMPLECLANELSKSFPAKNDGRGNEMSL